MFEGKTRAAMRLLTDQNKGGVLQLSDIIPSNNPHSTTVREILESKHPPSHPAQPDILLQPDNPVIHPVVFDSIDATVIRTAALRTDGAAGPSGIDARGWRRLCSSFQTASNDLCNSMALLAKQLGMDFVNSQDLAPLLVVN